MLLHELGKNVLFLLFVAGWQTHFLLSLVVHHLLDKAASFALQVGQLRRFRVDFLCGNWWIAGHQSIPPRHLVDFLERQNDRIVFDDPD